MRVKRFLLITLTFIIVFMFVACTDTTYPMTKLEVISKLNSEGKIVDMAGAQVLDSNIYVLMDNGKLYSFECK